MARRLKVFEARIGFYDTVVAAPSRAAALRAWGVQQDLFHEGQARESEDPAAIEAAKDAPEVVLRRPAGGKGGFEREPVGLPDAPPARRRPSGRSEPARRRARPEAPPALAKPDRRALDKAEEALADLDARQAAELAALEAKRAALEARVRTIRNAHAEARRKALAAIAEARKAFRRAGGAP